jgi:hypothetical protein
VALEFASRRVIGGLARRCEQSRIAPYDGRSVEFSELSLQNDLAESLVQASRERKIGRSGEDRHPRGSVRDVLLELCNSFL